MDNPTKLYPNKFYAQRESKTRYAANVILDILFKDLEINSALDLGCGNGVWLSELERRDVSRTLGVDGPWVPRNLFLSQSDYLEHNFAQEKFIIKERFDLVICLEMFEHIPEERAIELISTISSITDRVLFSAAVPNQGGNGHINEQYLSYWVKLFRDEGFYLNDTIRPEIWNDRDIPYWYRQNIVVFSRVECPTQAGPIDIIHPETLIEKSTPSFRRSLSNLLGSIRKRLS